jgi:hypothetical protein
MDARSSEPGLDIPQTRQGLEPALTSAPQPLQAKANIASESLILTARTLRRCDYSASKASEEGADFREAFAIYRSAPVFGGACSRRKSEFR